MLTLEHYRNVFANNEVWRAARNTLFLGLVGASATMVLGASLPMSRRARAGADAV